MYSPTFRVRVMLP